MKKITAICLVLIFGCALWLSGCVTREQAQTGAEGDATPAPQTAGETPAPTPEPTPTPLPYELAASADPVEHGFCESDADVFDAVERIRANAAAATGEKPALSGTSLTDGEQTGGRVAQGDGLLYLLADNDLVIVKAEGEASEILSRTPVGVSWKGETNAAGAYQGREKVPAAVFCSGNRAAVLSDWYGYDAGSGAMEYSEYVSVDVFDVTDPAAPQQTAALGQDGTLRAARICGGRLLLVTEYKVYDDASRDDAGDYIPSYYSADLATLVSGDRICADREGIFPGGAVVGLYDLSESRLADIQVLLGVSADACMAEDAVVFYSPRRAESFSRDVTGDRGTGKESVYAECTDLFVYRVENGSLTRPTVGAVNGTIADSVCLDLHDGTLRCLTALDQGRFTVYGGSETVTEDAQTGSVLLILDESLSQIGSIETLPDGSRIGWAGFALDRILLSNEERTACCAAVVKGGAAEIGELVADDLRGRYIRRFGDGAYVLYDQNELGRMTLTICDAAMRTLAEKSFGSDHSSTLENHRAYLADEALDLLTLTADDSYCIYGYSAEKGITLRADVYLNDWAWNAVGVVIGENLYVIDTKEVRGLSLQTLEEVLDLKL